jgi:uncharacterized delta-60 repeat protein
VVAGVFTAAKAVAVQPDGKVVIAGYTAFDSNYAISDMFVARFNTDGTPDADFGNGGKYIADFAGGADSAAGMALAPDGKIVVGGTVWNGSAYDWGIVRFTASGQPDADFASGGRFFFGLGSSNGIGAVAVQPDGKILAAGHVARNFAVARLDAQGRLDGTFGEAGFAVNDLGATDVINALALAPDGWIYAAGYRVGSGNADLALAQYSPDGKLTPCPDPAACDRWPTGVFLMDVGINDYAYGLDIRGDHQLVAAGCINQHFAGVQVRTDGEPVPLHFGTDFLGYPDCANAVTFTGGDKVVMAGNQDLYNFSSDWNMALARFETTPDESAPPPPPTPVNTIFMPLVGR